MRRYNSMIRYNILIQFGIIILFVFWGIVFLKAEETSVKRHRFSCTCKAESVIDLFSKQEERQKAIAWFKKHGIEKVYIESWRHGRFAEESLLRTVKNDFQNAGLEIAGCITTTTREIKPLTLCVAGKKEHEQLQKIVERTAAVFDLIILDDFLFTWCTCPECQKAKGNRTWGDFRSELQLELGRTRILEPARKVNPKVKIIIKYPCWYEGFYSAGYDVLKETDLYDYCWIGTETREPTSSAAGRRPQTQASWIQGWTNDFAKEKSGGAWFDPIDTKPNTYVEQARQTILGGSRETLLHCYDYLGTKTPGIAVHGTDTELKNGVLDADAFCHEKDSLQFMAELLADMTPRGVLVPKKPDDDPKKECYLVSFIGMLGIPVLPAASLKDAPAASITIHSAAFDNLHKYIQTALDKGKPLLLSYELLQILPEDMRKKIGISNTWLNNQKKKTFMIPINDTISILRSSEDHWKLMDLDPKVLDQIRNNLLVPFGLKMNAPSRVSLHLFESGGKYVEAIENFNDKEVRVVLEYGKSSGKRHLLRAFPDKDSVRIVKTSENTIELEIAPRSLALLAN